MKKNMSLYIDKKLIEKLKENAENLGLSLNAYITMILKEKINNEKQIFRKTK